MPDQRKGFGKEGESLAAAFLRERGLAVLAENFSTPAGEIDLVCLDGGIVVFVEVKTRHGADFGFPEEAITGEKRSRLARAAHRFLVRRQWEDKPFRFDAVAIQTQSGEEPEILHYENIDMPEAPC